MTYRQHSAAPDKSDWRLACRELRRSARWRKPASEADRQMKKAFTADEAARIDAFFEAAQHDTGRLAAIEARLNGGHRRHEVAGRATAPPVGLMEELRDRIDDAGSMMTSYVESAIGYVRWSREASMSRAAPGYHTPLTPARSPGR